jgi:hypothetical protein
MAILDSRQLSDIQVPNQKLPAEGPRTIPLVLDFSAQTFYVIDLTNQQVQTRISMVQTVYIDLKDTDSPLLVQVGGTNQVIKAKGRTQGYYTVLAPAPTNFIISSQAGILIPVELCNAPIAGVVWATQ